MYNSNNIHEEHNKSYVSRNVSGGNKKLISNKSHENFNKTTAVASLNLLKKNYLKNSNRNKNINNSFACKKSNSKPNKQTKALNCSKTKINSLNNISIYTKLKEHQKKFNQGDTLINANAFIDKNATLKPKSTTNSIYTNYLSILKRKEKNLNSKEKERSKENNKSTEFIFNNKSFGDNSTYIPNKPKNDYTRLNNINKKNNISFRTADTATQLLYASNPINSSLQRQPLQNNQINENLKSKSNPGTPSSKKSNEKNIDDSYDNIYFSKEKISKTKNVQIPTEYINQIYHNLLLEEMADIDPKPSSTYMNNQTEITEQMRSVLINWIIEVHFKFNFTEETLYMTVLILDRYLTLIKNVKKSKLQLVGIVSLLIACKHEEIILPRIEDFIYITDNAYTKDEVISMENEVLNKLKFNLLFPSPLKFFELLGYGFEFTDNMIFLGKYLMESFLISVRYIKYRPSIIACASAYFVMKFFKIESYSQAYNEKYCKINGDCFYNYLTPEILIKDCVKDICIVIDSANKNNFINVYKKFSKEKYGSVANMLFGK